MSSDGDGSQATTEGQASRGLMIAVIAGSALGWVLVLIGLVSHVLILGIVGFLVAVASGPIGLAIARRARASAAPGADSRNSPPPPPGT